MATPGPTGAGILFVISRIARPDVLDQETFTKWYSTEHIPDVLNTSGVDSALRFKNKDPKAEKPYLVLYPMQDIGFSHSEEFRNVKIHSDLFPGGGPFDEYVDLDASAYAFIDKFEPDGPTEPGQTTLLVPGGFDLGDKITEQDFHDWYNKEHFANLAKVPGYLRSTRYQLLWHRSSAQMRAARGVPPREGNVESPTPVKFLALHEFTTDEVDMKAFIATIDTDWSRRILGGAARAENPAYYQFLEGHGDGELF